MEYCIVIGDAHLHIYKKFGMEEMGEKCIARFHTEIHDKELSKVKFEKNCILEDN